MSLLTLLVGQTATLAAPSNPYLQIQLMRMGLSEGAQLTLKSKVPAGPMVFECNGTEIALGHDICKQLHPQPQPHLSLT